MIDLIFSIAKAHVDIYIVTGTLAAGLYVRLERLRAQLHEARRQIRFLADIVRMRQNEKEKLFPPEKRRRYDTP